MFKSKEIRWFTHKPDSILLDWFVARGLNFDNTEPRTDFYLPLEKNDLNVKLREGKIEIKHRIQSPVQAKLTPKAEGFIEEWIKWSFAADQTDRLSHDIISENKFNWTKTKKTRLGVKLKYSDRDGGEPVIVPIYDFISRGCQIEYTKILVSQKVYYTFAFEWFGDPYPAIGNSFLAEIPGNSVLKPENSKGYACFLKSLHQKN
jgi:hypothetical protein